MNHPTSFPESTSTRSLNQPSKQGRARGSDPAWRISIRRFFARPAVEIWIGILVLVSVLLTILELWLESELNSGLQPVLPGTGPIDHDDLHWMSMINDLITGIFVVELTFRFIGARNKKEFLAEFWLDIVATLPLFRIFPGGQALRLLRLFRLLRLLGVMSRLSSHFPAIFRRGAIDFLTITGLLLMAVLFGTAAMTISENVGAAHNQRLNAGPPTASDFDIENSFWYSLYTLFAGEPIPQPPKTVIGKIVTVILMFMGLTIFAIFAGTVSAFMVDRLRLEGRVVRMKDLSDHIVICGWTPKTEVILKEYRSSKSTRHMPIVIISETEVERMDAEIERLPNVFVIQDDFTRVSALERACIQDARICIVLADTTGGRSEQDADARTILASLTVEKLNPDVYTCAELFNRSYGTHLETGKVNEFVVSEEYGAYVIAQAGMHRGLISVLGELLTYRHGNEFFRTPVPEAWVGRTFNEMLAEVKQTHNAILVAVHSGDKAVTVNPDHHVFASGDEIVAICHHRVDLA